MTLLTRFSQRLLLAETGSHGGENAKWFKARVMAVRQRIALFLLGSAITTRLRRPPTDSELAAGAFSLASLGWGVLVGRRDAAEVLPSFGGPPGGHDAAIDFASARLVDQVLALDGRHLASNRVSKDAPSQGRADVQTDSRLRE